MKRVLCLFFLLLGIAACEVNDVSEPLTGAAAVNATAVSARQTANAANILASGANAFANSVEGKQTAVKQVTRDFAEARSTNLALQFASDNATASATRVIATEAAHVANQTATATREHATQIALTKATAIQQQKDFEATREARAIATQTAIIMSHLSRAQQTRDAENMKDEIAKREEQRQIQAATLDARTWSSWVSEAIGVLWLPVSGALLLIIILISIWRVFGAVTNRIHASSMAAMPAPQVITDGRGNVLGYLTPVHGGYAYEAIKSVAAPIRDESVTSPLTITSSVDMKRLESPTAPPDPQVLNGEIHRAALESFVTEILKTGDWTQTTWADRVIPLGAPPKAKVAYVLTKDTKGGDGKPIYGGYSRVMQLFVDKNLIIGRRTGASGKWNPNAPRTVGEVMAILFNAAPKPSLPTTIVESSSRASASPSPTLSASAGQ